MSKATRKTISILAALMVAFLLYVPLTSSSYATIKTGKYYYTNQATTTFYTKAKGSSSSIKVWYDTKIKVVSKVSSSKKGKWYKVRINKSTKNYYLWIPKNASRLRSTCAKNRNYIKSSNTDYQNQVVSKALYFLKKTKTAYDYKKTESDGVKRNGKYTFHCSGFASYVINSVMQKDVPPYKVTANLDNLYTTRSILNEGIAGEVKATKVCGKTLKLDKLKPGDLVFFKMGSSSRTVDHTAIYIGNGNIIQSSKSPKGSYFDNGKNTTGGVCISPLTGVYKRTFVGAVRYLPAKAPEGANLMKETVSGTKLYSTRECTSGTDILVIPSGDMVTLMYTYSIGDHNNAYVNYNDQFGYVYKYDQKLIAPENEE